MLISIQSVNVTRAPKGYSIAEVTYLREGREEARKVMSFVNEGVFKTVSEFKVFPVDVNVTLAKERGKDGKDYWQWKAIEQGQTVQNDVTAKAVDPKIQGGKVYSSNYETPTERAKRQVYIVRQSSLSNAIALMAARSPKGAEVNVESVIEVAKQFEEYVLNVEVV